MTLEVLIDGVLEVLKWEEEHGMGCRDVGCLYYWPVLASDRARQTWRVLLNDDLALWRTDLENNEEDSFRVFLMTCSEAVQWDTNDPVPPPWPSVI